MGGLIRRAELFNELAPVQTLGEAYAVIQGMPEVDAVEAVHGWWKAVKVDEDDYKRICSCCGKEAPYDTRDEDPLSEGYYMLYPYCPHCGARMYGKDGERNGTK